MLGAKTAAAPVRAKPVGGPPTAAAAPQAPGQNWQAFLLSGWERSRDRAAPGLFIHRKCACSGGEGKCDACNAEMLSRAADGAAPGGVPAAARRVLASPGAPLAA